MKYEWEFKDLKNILIYNTKKIGNQGILIADYLSIEHIYLISIISDIQKTILYSVKQIWDLIAGKKLYKKLKRI